MATSQVQTTMPVMKNRTPAICMLFEPVTMSAAAGKPLARQ